MSPCRGDGGLVDALDVVAQHGAVLVVPVGRDRGHFARMRMKEVDRSFVGSELLEKRPVVGSGDGDQRQVGPRFPDMGDLGGELCVALPASGPTFSVECRPCSDRYAGRLAPARFLAPVGAKWNPVERNGAGASSGIVFACGPSPPSPSSACPTSSTDA